METPFDKGANPDEVKVKINKFSYLGSEVVMYFEEILKGLEEQETSLSNKAQYFNTIKTLIDIGDNSLAAVAVINALKRYPDEISFLDQKTEIYIRMKEFGKAEKTLEAALDKHPYDTSLLMKKAKMFIAMEDDKSLEKVYREIVEIPRNDYVTGRSKLVAARSLIDIYIRERRFNEAEELAAQIIKSSPDESMWAMYFNVLLKVGKKDESEIAKNKFARFKRARAYFDKGSEYELQNKFNLALANYRKGLEIYPDDPLANMKVGSILMYRKKWYSKAQEYIEKAVQLDPRNAGFRSSLVICLRNLGKYREAYEEAKTAEKLEPLSNVHQMRRLALRLDRVDDFTEFVQEAINKDKNAEFPSLRFELGLFYENIGDQEKADELYHKALDLYLNRLRSYPGDWETYMDLGHCCKRLKMYKEAESAFKNAEKIKGADLEEVYENLVDIYQKSRQPEKSTPYLKNLIKQKPGNVVNYIDLGINFLTRMTSSMRKSNVEKK